MSDAHKTTPAQPEIAWHEIPLLRRLVWIAADLRGAGKINAALTIEEAIAALEVSRDR